MSPRGDRMDLDKAPKEELKIRGQAEVDKSKVGRQNSTASLHVANDFSDQTNSLDSKEIDLKRRESELKEKALRNKIVRNRELGTADAR